MNPAEHWFAVWVERVALVLDLASGVVAAGIVLLIVFIAVDTGRLRWPWAERTVIARVRWLRGTDLPHVDPPPPPPREPDTEEPP